MPFLLCRSRLGTCRWDAPASQCVAGTLLHSCCYPVTDPGTIRSVEYCTCHCWCWCWCFCCTSDCCHYCPQYVLLLLLVQTCHPQRAHNTSIGSAHRVGRTHSACSAFCWCLLQDKDMSQEPAGVPQLRREGRGHIRCLGESPYGAPSGDAHKPGPAPLSTAVLRVPPFCQPLCASSLGGQCPSLVRPSVPHVHSSARCPSLVPTTDS